MIDILSNAFGDELPCIGKEFTKGDIQDVHGTGLWLCKGTGICLCRINMYGERYAKKSLICLR